MKIFHVYLLFTLILWSGCGSAQNSKQAKQAAVKANLAAHLEADPNVEMCKGISDSFAQNNYDALKPYYDTEKFVGRVLAQGTVHPDIENILKMKHDEFPNFYRFMFPKGSTFECLGTREFRNESHVAIRVRQPSGRFNYALFHLTGDRIDDYFTASGGFYHSELNYVAMSSPESDMKIVNTFLLKSYENKFDEIIEGYEGLSESLKNHPVVFMHFINAVLEIKKPGTEIYTRAQMLIEDGLAGRNVSQHYWRMMDGSKRGDRQTYASSRDALIETFDDYALLD